MAEQTLLEKARERFKMDRFATNATGIVIEEVAKNYAKCSLKVEDRHLNAANSVMGGALFTLADFVFAVATNTDTDQLTVTTVSQISYVGVCKGDTLYGESVVLKDGRRNCFFQINITDNLGNLVAVVNTSGAHLAKKL